MSKFIIEKSIGMSGEIMVSGNKNEILPCIAATCLTDQDVILKNVPCIRDVDTMLAIFESIGGHFEWRGEHELLLNAAKLSSAKLPADLMAKLRASIVLAGPLLARFGEVFIPKAGGDKIGTRQIDTHLKAFEKLGAIYTVQSDGILITAPNGLLPIAFMLDEQGVTPTENVLMAAALLDGVSEIYFAACEPHVQGLCHMLNAMGASIEGIGTNKLRIKGSKILRGVEHTIGHDFNEAASFLCLGVATDSDITLTNVECEHYGMIALVFEKLGVIFERDYPNKKIILKRGQSKKIQNYSDGKISKITDMPWPGFSPDLMSTAIVLATQCRGEIYFQDWMYDGRMYFIDSLNAMGAKIVFCDPHRVMTIGSTPLFAQKLVSPDIRAGMALVIAGLCADGTTEIDNIEHIDRGYERLEQKLQKIGARIRRV